MILSLLLFSLSLSLAAPFPTTGSSLFLNTQKNLFLAPLGLRLDLEKTNAKIRLDANDEEKWHIQFPGEQQIYSLRIRSFKSDLDYERSLKYWLREYQKGGLRIVQEKIRGKRPQSGWIHLEDSAGRQIFQYFSYGRQTWAYFGCAGSKEHKDLLQERCALLNSRLKFDDELLDKTKRSTKEIR